MSVKRPPLAITELISAVISNRLRSVTFKGKGLLQEKHFRIINIDTIVVLDQPKLAPYMKKIKESLAAMLATEAMVVNVKAKTSEGSSPDMAVAHAVVLLAGP